MKTHFNKAQIADIAKFARQYKRLYVTTEGCMFLVREDAELSVRTKNMIVAEPDDFVGLKTIYESDVTKELLQKYAKDTTLFDALFEDATIPRQKSYDESHVERSRKKNATINSEVADEIDSILGDAAKPTVETKKKAKAITAPEATVDTKAEPETLKAK